MQVCPPSSHLRLEVRSGGLVVLDSLAGGGGGTVACFLPLVRSSPPATPLVLTTSPHWLKWCGELTPLQDQVQAVPHTKFSPGQLLPPELSLPLISSHMDSMQLVEHSASLGSPVYVPFLLFEILPLSLSYIQTPSKLTGLFFMPSRYSSFKPVALCIPSFLAPPPTIAVPLKAETDSWLFRVQHLPLGLTQWVLHEYLFNEWATQLGSKENRSTPTVHETLYRSLGVGSGSDWPHGGMCSHKTCEIPRVSVHRGHRYLS